jgi:hypothetical protein
MSEQPPYEPGPQPPGAQPPHPQNPQQPGPPPPGWQPAPPAQYGYGPPRPTPGNAVTALILGILGLVMCGPFTAIPAIIVGRQAVREIDASQGQLDGRATAQAGFVLGIVGTVLGGLALLFVIVVFVLGGVLSNSFEDSCTGTDDDGGFTVQCD